MRAAARSGPLLRAARYAAVLALAATATACGAAAGTTSASDVAASSGTITETGSSLLAPLMKTWASAYQQSSGVTVNTESTSSGTGIADAAKGAADIGASDAYLSSGDLVKSPNLVNIPLAVSAQTIIYHLPGLSASQHVRLNGNLLAGIYQGDITKWDDARIAAVNPGLNLPNLKIVPIRRTDSSGDTFLFTSYLSTQNKTWNETIGYGTTAAWPAVSALLSEKGSLNVLQACEQTDGCVAYNGISYLSQAQQGGLGEAMLGNAVGQYTLPDATSISAAAAPFVALTPTNETISMIDGPALGGYPIVNYEYAVVSTRQPSAARAKDLRAFLSWILTTGNEGKYVDTVGFQPLPGDLVQLGQQQIAGIGS